MRPVDDGTTRRLKRLRQLLLISAGALCMIVVLILRTKDPVISESLARLGLGALSGAWLMLVGGVGLGVAVWIRSRQTDWWTVIAVLFLALLSWVVCCAVPAAMLT